MASPVGVSALQIGGGLLQGLGAETQGSAQAAASTYKAGVALLNKQIDQQNANFAIESGDIKAQETELQGEQVIANTTVTQAASGFVVGQGTNKAVTDSQRQALDFDENVIRWDASKTAWGFEAKAATDEAESNLDLMAAKSEKTAGEISMWTSFLNAGTNVAKTWMQASASGMSGGGG